jgi:hypothetical protein
MNLTQKQERLANEIASALNDMDSIQLHRQFVQKYSEEHLRKCLEVALKVKEEKVRKSRGAIYTAHVLRYGYHSGN